MARLPSLLVTTLFSSLLVSGIHAATGDYVPPPPNYPSGNTPASTDDGDQTSHITTTTRVPVTVCATPQISTTLITSLHVSTVSYVTTQAIVQTLTQSYCPPPATCVTGGPVTTGGYTLTYAEIKPTPYVANYVPNPDWETGSGHHQIGSVNFEFYGQYQAYAEFKCQFQCGYGCESFFVAFNTAENHWTCTWYNALIPGSILIPPPAGKPYVSGAGFNHLCGPQPTLTAPITDPFPSATSTDDGAQTSNNPTTKPVTPTYGPPGGGNPTSGQGGGQTFHPPTNTPPVYTPPGGGNPTSGQGGGQTSHPPSNTPPVYTPPGGGNPTSSQGGGQTSHPPTNNPPVYTPPGVPTSSQGGVNGGYPTTLHTTPKPPVYTPPGGVYVPPFTMPPMPPMPTYPPAGGAPPPPPAVGGGLGGLGGLLGGLGGLTGGLGGLTGILGGLRRHV